MCEEALTSRDSRHLGLFCSVQAFEKLRHQPSVGQTHLRAEILSAERVEPEYEQANRTLAGETLAGPSPRRRS